MSKRWPIKAAGAKVTRLEPPGESSTGPKGEAAPPTRRPRVPAGLTAIPGKGEAGSSAGESSCTGTKSGKRSKVPAKERRTTSNGSPARRVFCCAAVAKPSGLSVVRRMKSSPVPGKGSFGGAEARVRSSITKPVKPSGRIWKRVEAACGGGRGNLESELIAGHEAEAGRAEIECNDLVPFEVDVHRRRVETDVCAIRDAGDVGHDRNGQSAAGGKVAESVNLDDRGAGRGIRPDDGEFQFETVGLECRAQGLLLEGAPEFQVRPGRDAGGSDLQMSFRFDHHGVVAGASAQDVDTATTDFHSGRVRDQQRVIDGVDPGVADRTARSRQEEAGPVSRPKTDIIAIDGGGGLG